MAASAAGDTARKRQRSVSLLSKQLADTQQALRYTQQYHLEPHRLMCSGLRQPYGRARVSDRVL